MQIFIIAFEMETHCEMETNREKKKNEEEKKNAYARTLHVLVVVSTISYYYFLQPRWCFERARAGRLLKDSNNNNNNNNESRERCEERQTRQTTNANDQNVYKDFLIRQWKMYFNLKFYAFHEKTS